MGYYTEFIIGCSLRKDTPKEVIDEIKCLTQENYGIPKIHTGRNPLNFGSEYFCCQHTRFFKDKYKGWVLDCRSNLKDYNDEIEKFIEWIRPWVDRGSGARGMWAIVIGEGIEEPTIHYLFEAE